jgi:hypothetical protein
MQTKSSSLEGFAASKLDIINGFFTRGYRHKATKITWEEKIKRA